MLPPEGQWELITAEITANIPTTDLPIRYFVTQYWDNYADKTQMSPRLQPLYTKWGVLGLLEGLTWRKVDVAQDNAARLSLSQQFKALQGMRDEVWKEIRYIESRVGANRPGANGLLTTTTISVPPQLAPPPPPYVTANDQRYRGDPYAPGEDTFGGFRP